MQERAGRGDQITRTERLVDEILLAGSYEVVEEIAS